MSAWTNDLTLTEYGGKNARQILGPGIKKVANFNLPALRCYREPPMGENWISFLEDERPHRREMKTARELPTLTVRLARKMLISSLVT